MKWLSAGLVFVNLSTVCGLLLGMAGNGLNERSAILALVAGASFAVAAYLGTFDPPARLKNVNSSAVKQKRSNSKQRRLESVAQQSASSPARRYRHLWLWVMAACFAVFAMRSFCWLLYIDGNELKIQSPNNLGDLALHITLIRNFASGISLWPDNPIYVFSKLRYPAGIDLFNALLCLIHVNLIRGLVWTGLLASLATFYAFFRWAGTFGVAGFLFNGGIAGFQFFKTLKFLDYQGDKTIAWKSIALSMFVTQRGLLYAIPAGLLLLWHWREKFFRSNAAAGSGDSGSNAIQLRRNGPLPFWIELSLYASMPLFHVHTFLALSIVLFFLFVSECLQPLKLIVDLLRTEGIDRIPRLILDRARWRKAVGDTRMHSLTVVAGALLPASFFTWLTTDHFRAGSMLKLHLGWVMSDPEFGRSNVFQFWFENFGIFIPFALYLIAVCGWRAWETGIKWNQKLPEEITFLLPASTIFVSGLVFRFATWDWDNLKLMMWGYFLLLPFLWTDLIARWTIPARIGVCIALFGSGFISLFGGLAAGRQGFGFADRAELDAVGDAVRRVPVEARFAAYPTYNHPLLLQGRKVALGYPGHLWSQGFADYTKPYDLLNQLMQGAQNWREIARALCVRYIFWGREEGANYPASKRPWENTAPVVASGRWGVIYNLEPTPP